MTSKERGHVSRGKVVPRCGAVGLWCFQLPFDPWPRGGTSAGALRSIGCSGHGFSPRKERCTHLLWGSQSGMQVGMLKGCRSQGKGSTSLLWTQRKTALPCQGHDTTAPLEGKPRHKPLTQTHQRTEGCCCLAMAGDLPCWQHQSSRMPLGAGHLPPCKENPHKAFSSHIRQQ